MQYPPVFYKINEKGGLDMTKKSLFLTLSFTLALVFLLTACQKTQTVPTEQNQNPPALSQTDKGEPSKMDSAVSDLPTADDTVSTQLPATDKTPVSDTGTANHQYAIRIKRCSGNDTKGCSASNGYFSILHIQVRKENHG